MAKIAKRVIAALILAMIAAIPAHAKGLKLRIKPKQLSLGKVMAGTVSAPKFVTLSNRNSVALSLGPITASPPFAETDDCTPSLAAGASCQISVTFAPGIPSNPKHTTEQGTLTITDDANKSPQAVKLTGVAFGGIGIFAVNTVSASGVPNSVTAYPLGSNGDVAPSIMITGANTGILTPFAISLDSSGTIYVSSGGAADANSAVETFPSGGHGDIAPRSIISGANTGLNAPAGIAVDSIGNIYVANETGGPVSGSITIYPPASKGNVSPSAVISAPCAPGPTCTTPDNTGLDLPIGITVDSGGKIYVANNGNDSITAYAAGSSGNATPVSTISGLGTRLSLPSAVAVDSAGTIYVTNLIGGSSGSGIITIYSPGSDGDAPPTAAITGFHTGLDAPRSISLDSAGNIYVLGGAGITVYPAGSEGDASPTATITGSNTELNAVSITIGPMGP